jgi:23S rRNA pseudouridine1911/1915/1917 synthase
MERQQPPHSCPGQRGHLNRGWTYREAVRGDAVGRTVLDYLTARYAHSSREEWTARIAEGRVQVDGKPARPESELCRAQLLMWHRPPWLEPAVPRSFAVLHRDADVLAIAKPGGLPTLPGAAFLESTLLHLVRRQDPEAVPVHRLGRGTSGIVLFALSARARSRLTEAFRTRQVRKVYRGLIQGSPSRDHFSVDVPIGPVAHPFLGTVHAASQEGMPAHSTVRVLERGPGGSLVEIRITTGRPHQIRIHLAAAGHPLVGDPLYGAGGLPMEGSAVPGDVGYSLHAQQLALPHPDTGDRLELFCGCPTRLRRL